MEKNPHSDYNIIKEKLDANPIVSRVKRVRSQVSSALSTISMPHSQASESAFKYTQYSQRTRFLLFFENSKNYSKTTVSWKLLGFWSDIATPVRRTELRKNFHMVTHIFSIRSRYFFFISFFLLSESYLVTLENHVFSVDTNNSLRVRFRFSFKEVD